MPTRFLEDGATPVVQFDPQLEVSPFAVFRSLREERGPLLIDVRPMSAISAMSATPGAPGALTLAGALPYPGPDWTPPSDQDVVLFDEDGAIAIEGARHMQAAGYPRVKALFGGLDLWEFSLDPEVVGADTYLVRR
jgi:rhodanese-related sulfurtransferase